MDYESQSDKALQAELGNRLKAWRLRKNRTQKALAKATGLSVNAIKALEVGKGKLANLIAVLRELGALAQLDNFIPEPGISPIQLAKLHGKPRERASGQRAKNPSEDDTSW